MKKIIYFCLLPFTSYLLLSNAPVFSNQPAPAQETAKPSFLSWLSETFLSKKPPIKPRKNGTRNQNNAAQNIVCMISPDDQKNTRIIWSDRPKFIWQGKVKKIVVIHRKSESEWTKSVTEDQNIAAYTDERRLQPGQTYEWQVWFGKEQSMRVKFKVMEAQQRDRVTTDLQNLENQLKAEGQDTEAIALAKAKYFAENQLWADVLQQLYSVPTPSTELSEFHQEIPDKLCNPQIN
jgi:Domain of Unknown Function (DUF928)